MFFIANIGGIVLASITGGQLSNPQIAYQSYRDDQTDIIVIDIERSIEFNITRDNPYDANSPQWSPDGQRILYAARHGEKWDLYLMHESGRHNRRLTQNSSSNYLPTWSPDGQHIAFASDRDGDWEIFIMNIHTLETNQLTFNRYTDSHPYWSADGETIYFSSWRNNQQDLFGITPEGQNLRAITNDLARDTGVHLSPDGNHLVWLTERAPTNVCRLSARNGDRNAQTCILHVDIYRMVIDGRDPVRLTYRTGRYWSPRWSPDGTQIAYAGATYGDYWSIYTMYPDGTSIQRLSRGEGRDNFPNWRP